MRRLDDWHLTEWACEGLGTAILVFGGLSAVALDFGAGSPVARLIPSTSARLLLTGLLFAGTGSLIAISPIGRRSGAHINPAISLAFWMTRHMHHHDFGGYVAAQFLGATAGAAAWHLAWGQMAQNVRDGLTLPGPGITDWQAVVMEAAMTAALVATIFLFVARPRTMRLTPLAVWILVAFLVWQAAHLTGTSLNPARSTGPAIASATYHSLWVYFAGPVAGALTAVALAHLMNSVFWPRTAKMFHDPSYPSIFMRSTPRNLGMMMRAGGEAEAKG